jgi:ArsR family transcriptional regulator, arsenate/arsenite/antimonite-responsive transcriptional repressor
LDIDKYLYIKVKICGGVKLIKNYGEYALFLKALSDETRVKIFDMLSDGELCACKILEDFNITQPTLSYHMKILCDSGLVNSRRDGVWMKYSINKNNLDSLRNFFNDLNLKN